jgi:hypothetical protein
VEGEQISPLVFVERSAVATDLVQLLEVPFAGRYPVRTNMSIETGTSDEFQKAWMPPGGT